MPSRGHVRECRDAIKVISPHVGEEERTHCAAIVSWRDRTGGSGDVRLFAKGEVSFQADGVCALGYVWLRPHTPPVTLQAPKTAKVQVIPASRLVLYETSTDHYSCASRVISPGWGT